MIPMNYDELYDNYVYPSLEIEEPKRAFLIPFVLVLEGSKVVKSFRGITKKHAVARATRYCNVVIYEQNRHR